MFLINNSPFVFLYTTAEKIEKLKKKKKPLFFRVIICFHGSKVACEVSKRLDAIFDEKHSHSESAPSLQNNKVVKPQQEAAVRPHRLLPTASRPVD